jgi:hypothetical protein|nr:MAG TPA: major capsid protein [Caudoviricetes sp.]
MNVQQIYTIINTVTNEELGLSEVVQEDLSNIVDVGTAVFNANALDNYVKSLVDHIGRVVFVNRPYRGSAPSVIMDGWEYGSVLEKITCDLPEATENESWELTNGQSYDPNVFYKPTVSAKFYNKRVTFEIPMSFTERQVKESFSSAEQLNAFMSMLYTAIENSMTVKLDGLVMRTINNMIGETFNADFTGQSAGKFGNNSTMRCVNLLFLYNQTVATKLTSENCLSDPSFIRFAAALMQKYVYRLGKLSTLFNVGKKERFTPKDRLHFILLADFMTNADVYLQSNTFHNEFTALPNAELVPFWQGSGLSYDMGEISEINIKTGSGTIINPTGILGVMFDRDALGVTNMNRRVTSNYNPKAEFFNNWYKMDAGYFNDLNENFVVWYVADSQA